MLDLLLRPEASGRRFRWAASQAKRGSDSVHHDAFWHAAAIYIQCWPASLTAAFRERKAEGKRGRGLGGMSRGMGRGLGRGMGRGLPATLVCAVFHCCLIRQHAAFLFPRVVSKSLGPAWHRRCLQIPWPSLAQAAVQAAQLRRRHSLDGTTPHFCFADLPRNLDAQECAAQALSLDPNPHCGGCRPSCAAGEQSNRGKRAHWFGRSHHAGESRVEEHQRVR